MLYQMSRENRDMVRWKPCLKGRMSSEKHEKTESCLLKLTFRRGAPDTLFGILCIVRDKLQRESCNLLLRRNKRVIMVVIISENSDNIENCEK